MDSDTKRSRFKNSPQKTSPFDMSEQSSYVYVDPEFAAKLSLWIDIRFNQSKERLEWPSWIDNDVVVCYARTNSMMMQAINKILLSHAEMKDSSKECRVSLEVADDLVHIKKLASCMLLKENPFDKMVLLISLGVNLASSVSYLKSLARAIENLKHDAKLAKVSMMTIISIETNDPHDIDIVNPVFPVKIHFGIPSETARRFLYQTYLLDPITSVRTLSLGGAANGNSEVQAKDEMLQLLVESSVHCTAGQIFDFCKKLLREAYSKVYFMSRGVDLETPIWQASSTVAVEWADAIVRGENATVPNPEKSYSILVTPTYVKQFFYEAPGEEQEFTICPGQKIVDLAFQRYEGKMPRDNKFETLFAPPKSVRQSRARFNGMKRKHNSEAATSSQTLKGPNDSEDSEEALFKRPRKDPSQSSVSDWEALSGSSVLNGINVRNVSSSGGNSSWY